MSIIDRFFGKRNREVSDDTAHALRVGDRVQWPGQGLGRIDRIEEKNGQPHFALAMDSRVTIFVPVSGATDAVWRLPTAAEARRLRASLFQPSAPDPRPFVEASTQFMKTITSGSLDDYATLARRMLVVIEVDLG